MKKRLFSGFLALVMVFSMLPGAAWAEETGPIAGENTDPEEPVVSPVAYFDLRHAVYDYQTMYGYDEETGTESQIRRTAYTKDMTFYLPGEYSMTCPFALYTTSSPTSVTVKEQGFTLNVSNRESKTVSEWVNDRETEVSYNVLSGTVYIPVSNMGKMTLQFDGEDVAAFTINTSSLQSQRAQGGTYLIDLELTSATGGQVTLDLSGFNVDVPAPSDYVLGYEDVRYDGEDYSKPSSTTLKEYYVGTSLTGSDGRYTLTMTEGKDYGDLASEGADEQYSRHGVRCNLFIKSQTAHSYAQVLDAFKITQSPVNAMSEWASQYGSMVTIPAVSSGNSISVKGETTTGSSATVTITNDGYTQMRYQVDGGDFTAWSAIPASVTISTPSVGTRTVSFEFRSDGGAVVSRSTTVTRQSTATLAAPVNLGIADAATEKSVIPNGGVYELMGSHDYLLFADLEDVAAEDKGDRAILVNGQYTLSWNSGKKRYEGTLNGGSFDGITSLVFRAKQEASDANAHGAETLSIHVTAAPKVYYGNTPWVPSSYEDGAYLVRPGTEIDCYFVGDSGDGITGWAELTYKVDDTISNNMTMARVQMTNNSGTYTGTVTAPAKDSGATGLVSIAYYLESGGQKSQVLSYTLSNYRMASVMTFSGFTEGAVDANNNSLGDYSGVNVEIRRTKDGNTENYYRYGHVGNDGTLELDQVDLNDGATYTYIIRGASGQIVEKTLTADMADSSGRFTPASLGLPRLYTLIINKDDATAALGTYVVSPRLVLGRNTPNETQIGVGWGNTIYQIPADTTGNVMAYVYLNDVSALVVKSGDTELPNGEVTINEDTTVTLSLTRFSPGNNITGTLYRPGKERPISGLGVSLTQNLYFAAGENGILNARTYSGWRYAYSAYSGTDEGRFSVEIPAGGQEATLEITGGGFKPKTIRVETDGKLYEKDADTGEFSATPITGNNIVMEYRDTLVVTPKLLVRPWNSPASTPYSEYAEGDSAQLHIQTLAKGGVTDNDYSNRLSYTSELTTDGRQLLFLDEYHKNADIGSARRLTKGASIGARYGEFAEDSDYVLLDVSNVSSALTQGTLDDNLNATVTAYAVHKAQVKATVVPLSEANTDLTGTLLIYRSWYYANHQLLGQATGRGELTIGGLPEMDPDGHNDEHSRYYAISLRYESKYAAQISSMIESGALWDAYFDGTAEAQAMVKVQRISVPLGYSRTISNMTPTLAGPALLGDYLMQYDAVQTRGDGTVEVSVWITPTISDPRPITNLYVYRTNSLDGEDVTVNNETLATSTWWGGYYTNGLNIGESIQKYSSKNFDAGDGVTSLRLHYLVRPNENRETAGSVVRFYYAAGSGGAGGSSALRVLTPTSLFGLSANQRQAVSSTFENGQPTAETISNWTIPVTVTASPRQAQGGRDPQQITIYDNGTAVGTYQVSDLTTSVKVQLSNPGVYGLHELYATRANMTSTDSGAVLTTDRITVNVVDPDLELNTNHLIWWHHNDRGDQQWRYEKMSELGAKTVRYYPIQNSAFAFVITNATEDQLKNVRLVTSYKDNKEYATYPATSISKEQFVALWNSGLTDGAIDADTVFPDTRNGKSITYSYWIVDKESIKGTGVTSSPLSDSFNVNQQGFSLGYYFSGFSVKYDYMGPATNLTLAALMPKSAATWTSMSDKAFNTMLGIVDYSEGALTRNSLRAYYAVGDAQGDLGSFGTKADILDTIKGNDTDKKTKLQDDIRDFLRSEVDDLPAVLRDSVNKAVNEEDSSAVTYEDNLDKDDVKEAAGLNDRETVLDAYTVTVKGETGEGATLGDTVVTNSLSTVNIKSEDYGENRNGGNWLNTTDPTKASYVDPNSDEAVRWLMNYERDKKYNGTDAEKARYAGVSWTHYETEQGTVYERYEVTETPKGDGTYEISAKTDTYLPGTAVKALMGDEYSKFDWNTATVSFAGGAAPTLRNAPLVASAGPLTGDMLNSGATRPSTLVSLAGDPFSKEKVQTGMQRFETLGTITSFVGQADNIRHTYQTAQMVKTGYVTTGFASQIADGQRMIGSKVGTALNVINAGVTVYNINNGPQGKSEDVLFNNIHKIKDADTRSELQQDILDYADRKGRLYLGESFTGAVNAGASFSGNKAVQGATFLATLYANYKGRAAHQDLDAEFDALVSRINNAFTIQGVKDAREAQTAAREVSQALEQRLRNEGFEGSRLTEEMSKFNLVRAASGEYGYVPINGWNTPVGEDPTKLYGYVPEQPAPDKFEVDWGPSFGGVVPTQEQLAAFYGTENYGNELAMVEVLTEKVEEKKSESKSLSEMISKVEDDLKTAGWKDIDFENGYELEDEAGAFRLYIDPSGYAFEGVAEDRVPGVQATIYQGNADGTSFTQWEDTNENVSERQANPQYTAAKDNSDPDAGGRFGWMTPAGTWKVRFHGVDDATNGDAGGDTTEYQDTETMPMEVPPEHTQVNIGLLSKNVPEVAAQATLTGETAPQYSADQKLSAYKNQMELTFTKWMQLESLVDVSHASSGAETYDSEFSSVTVTDALGNVIPGAISFPDKTANTGYKASYKQNVYNENGDLKGTVTVTNPYQADFIGSDYFVKTVIFTPKTDFTTGDSYTMKVSKTALSYAGKPMGTDFEATVAAPETMAPKIYTITFVPGNGDATATVVTKADGTVTLPTEPTRSGYTFLGWYTATSGGERITASTVFTGNTRLYAQWRQNGGSSGSSGSGSAAVSTTASSGDTISANTIDRLISGKKELTVTGDNKATAVFSTDALKGIDKATNSSVTVKLEDVSDDYAKTYPDGEVYQLAVSAGSKELSNLDGDVTVTLPHDRGKEETNPDRIAVFALNGDGTVGERLDTDYDEKKGTVTFTTQETGTFLVEYVPFPFEDVAEDTYYYDAVDWADWNGITKGKAATVFDPLGGASRAEVVTFLWRCAGEPEPEGTKSSFPDVAEGTWYWKPVQWAYETRITLGFGDGTFRPDAPVDREQFVTFLYRMVGSAPAGENPFSDVDPDDWSYEAILWAAEKDVTKGTGGGYFNPAVGCDRAQVVTMLYRWFGK